MIYGNREALTTGARVVFNSLLAIHCELVEHDIRDAGEQQKFIEDNLIDRYNMVRRCIFVNEDTAHIQLLSELKKISADQRVDVNYRITESGVSFTLVEDKRLPPAEEFVISLDIWSLAASIKGVQLKLPSGRF